MPAKYTAFTLKISYSRLKHGDSNTYDRNHARYHTSKVIIISFSNQLFKLTWSQMHKKNRQSDSGTSNSVRGMTKKIDKTIYLSALQPLKVFKTNRYLVGNLDLSYPT